MYNLIAQGIGVIAMILGFFVYHFKTKKGILKMKFTANIFWTIHYLMIGAVSAFATAIVCDVRELVYAYEKNSKKRFVWLVIFVILCIISMLIMWKDATSILPGVATILSTYSFYQKDVRNMRFFAVIYTVMLLVYDIAVMSYPGIISQLIGLCSILLALYRFRKS